MRRQTFTSSGDSSGWSPTRWCSRSLRIPPLPRLPRPPSSVNRFARYSTDVRPIRRADSNAISSRSSSIAAESISVRVADVHGIPSTVTRSIRSNRVAVWSLNGASTSAPRRVDRGTKRCKEGRRMRSSRNNAPAVTCETAAPSPSQRHAAIARCRLVSGEPGTRYTPGSQTSRRPAASRLTI